MALVKLMYNINAKAVQGAEQWIGLGSKIFAFVGPAVVTGLRTLPEARRNLAAALVLANVFRKQPQQRLGSFSANRTTSGVQFGHWHGLHGAHPNQIFTKPKGIREYFRLWHGHRDWCHAFRRCRDKQEWNQSNDLWSNEDRPLAYPSILHRLPCLEVGKLSLCGHVLAC